MLRRITHLTSTRTKKQIQITFFECKKGILNLHFPHLSIFVYLENAESYNLHSVTHLQDLFLLVFASKYVFKLGEGVLNRLLQQQEELCPANFHSSIIDNACPVLRDWSLALLSLGERKGNQEPSRCEGTVLTTVQTCKGLFRSFKSSSGALYHNFSFFCFNF